MDPQTFIKNFADQFEDIDPSTFSLETQFRDIEDWSSLTALSIIAMVDESYKVKLTGDDIKKSKTLRDIFMIVKSKV